MTTYYLINPIKFGTSQLWPGDSFDSAQHDTAAIATAGGVLVDSSYTLVATAAGYAQEIKKRGGEIMEAAIGMAVAYAASGILAAGSVSATELAADAVETAKILNLNVTTAKLAPDAVTEDKLADDAVVPLNLKDSAVLPGTGAVGKAGVPYMIVAPFTAGTPGTADDVVVTDTMPGKGTLIDVQMVLTTGVDGSTATFRDAVGGAGTALSNAIPTATANQGSSRWNHTATPALAAGSDIYIRRSDRGIAGVAILTIMPTA